MIGFERPWLLLLVVGPALVALSALGSARLRAVVLLAGTAALAGHRPTLRSRLGWLPLSLRVTALTAMAVALAGPRTSERHEEVTAYGVDLILALDVSGSMQAEDFRPRNRLHVARDVVRRFIDSRPHDRLGLVIFAGKAYTLCPLTLQHELLKELVEQVDFGAVEHEGTAIGMALATAANRLRRSDARSRVIVLVTDGIQNAGALDPSTAAAAAVALGMRIYTVGVGTDGPVPFPTADGYEYVEVPLDEPALMAVAAGSGGYYFRATDKASFEEALERIGKLEKTELKVLTHVVHEAHFAPFLFLAVAALVMEAILAASWLRTVP